MQGPRGFWAPGPWVLPQAGQGPRDRGESVPGMLMRTLGPRGCTECSCVHQARAWRPSMTTTRRLRCLTAACGTEIGSSACMRVRPLPPHRNRLLDAVITSQTSASRRHPTRGVSPNTTGTLPLVSAIPGTRAWLAWKGSSCTVCCGDLLDPTSLRIVGPQGRVSGLWHSSHSDECGVLSGW